MFEQVEVFHRPTSVREAARLLANGRGRARIVAGGTDLVVHGDSKVRTLIDITHTGLNYIRQKDGVCTIGAATTMADLEESRIIRGLAGGMLAKAAATCGSVQIRGAATIGGNIANGSPAADLVTPLLVLGAVVMLAHVKGPYKLTLEHYLETRRGKTVRESLLVEILVPVIRRKRRAWSFQKLGRTEIDISLVNVAAGLQVSRAGRIEWIQIALGSVAPMAMLARGLDKMMTGHTLDAELVAYIAEIMMRQARPITDVRASAAYRREMCRVLTRRALEECAAQAGCAL